MSLAYPSIALEDWAGTTTGHPCIGMGNCGGTKAAPTATAAGRVLGTFIAYGHDGTGSVQSGRITFVTEATFAPTSNPISIVFSPGGGGSYSEVMRLRSDGKVGIGLGGSVPTHALQVGSDDAAKPSGGIWLAPSDIRLKKNVKPMTAALDRLAKLQGVSFEWIHPEEHGNNTGPQGGFIAQEVEELFPSWVTRSEASPKDKDLVGTDKVRLWDSPSSSMPWSSSPSRSFGPRTRRSRPGTPHSNRRTASSTPRPWPRCPIWRAPSSRLASISSPCRPPTSPESSKDRPSEWAWRSSPGSPSGWSRSSRASPRPCRSSSSCSRSSRTSARAAGSPTPPTTAWANCAGSTGNPSSTAFINRPAFARPHPASIRLQQRTPTPLPTAEFAEAA